MHAAARKPRRNADRKLFWNFFGFVAVLYCVRTINRYNNTMTQTITNNAKERTMTTLTAHGHNGFFKTCNTDADVEKWIRIAKRIGCTMVVVTGENARTIFFE